jgi:uncharacterized protein YicC (UPF0701 family)
MLSNLTKKAKLGSLKSKYMSSLVPITISSKPKKLTLPEYETLELIVSLSDRIKELEKELEQNLDELEQITHNYQLQLIQDEKEITHKINSELKRKNLSKEIQRMREAEKKLKQSINQKVKQILQQSDSLTDQESNFSRNLKDKILDKIRQQKTS